MKIQHKVVGGEHQFDVPAGEHEELTLSMRVTSEGIVLDVFDSSGESIRSAYQFWSDLEDMTEECK